jgi:hypothetical protein
VRCVGPCNDIKLNIISFAVSYPSCMLIGEQNTLCGVRNRDSSDGSNGLRGGQPRFDSRQGKEIFLYTTATRPALGPTQPHIQWVPGTLSPGVKRQGYEADHSLHLAPRSRMVELYLHSPICLHGIVLN